MFRLALLSMISSIIRFINCSIAVKTLYFFPICVFYFHKFDACIGAMFTNVIFSTWMQNFISEMYPMFSYHRTAGMEDVSM